MNAPFLVPTRTRTLLIACLLQFVGPAVPDMSGTAGPTGWFGLLFLRSVFPQAHDAAFWVVEENIATHAGDLLFFGDDFSTGGDDALRVGVQVVDFDVERHVARPGAFALGVHNAAVDAALAAGFNEVVFCFRIGLDFPVEGFGVEVGEFGGAGSPEFPVDDGASHDWLLRVK